MAFSLPVARDPLDDLILRAQKPSRYIGGELNAIQKDLSRVPLKWALAFPDIYEMGMSNVGFRCSTTPSTNAPTPLASGFFMPWAT